MARSTRSGLPGRSGTRVEVTGSSFFSYHHSLMMILTVAVILSCKCLIEETVACGRLTSQSTVGILLAGCSADRPGPRDLYLLAITYKNSSTTQGFSIRVGYFGICAQMSAAKDWTCGPDGHKLGITEDMDPWDIIATSQKFKDGVMFPGLL